MTAAPNFTQDSSNYYDPDDVVPKNSPILAPCKPRLSPSPSPPFITLTRSSTSRPKVKPSQGDAVLVAHLDGGRRPEIAIHAGLEVLPADSDEERESESSDESVTCLEQSAPRLGDLTVGSPRKHDHGTAGEPKAGQDRTMATEFAPRPDPGAFLKSLAAGALAVSETTKGDAADTRPSWPVSEQDSMSHKRQGTSIPAAITTRRDDSHPDERPVLSAGPSMYSPRSSIYSPHESSHFELTSPKVIGPNARGDLPPIHINSPRSDTNGQSLPSIRSQFGEELADLTMEKDGNLRHATYSNSPPGTFTRFSSIHLPHHGSPPRSPAEPFRRDMSSPGHPLTLSGMNTYNNNKFYQSSNGLHRPNPDYSSSNTETPNTDHSGSTPATSIDRLSIDGITHPPSGPYVCKFSGCTAPAFQTQYLLNSHANVHSSDRPHYCPVRGCPRSEGGKGFKRKNEMIRHGLVHDSPGYICPFCPDREHKYPRPDNLQRHVRVHHVDKDKDDPLLREVLSQRPDGPSRGRRRRGGPS